MKHLTKPLDAWQTRLLTPLTLVNPHTTLAGSTLPSLIDMIVKLYALHQPLVSRHSSEVLAAVAGSSSSHLGTAQLAQLLGMLIDGEASHALSGVCGDILPVQ
jgi:hypothetical protein